MFVHLFVLAKDYLTTMSIMHNDQPVILVSILPVLILLNPYQETQLARSEMYAGLVY